MKKTVENKLLIEKIVQEEKSPGGIILADTVRENDFGLRYGIVILVGPNCTSDIEVGDYIAFLAQSGSHFAEHGKKYVHLPEGKVLYYDKDAPMSNIITASIGVPLSSLEAN